MKIAQFIFHTELDYFLAYQYTGAPFSYSFDDHQTVKHLIEALGVPHTEVGRILANGKEVDSGYRLQNGDQIMVYPQPAPEEDNPAPEPRFVLDNHLGRLAAYLRMMNFDTLYRNDYQDDELAWIASQEGRILLTRDRRLLMRKVILHGYCVRQDDPQEQVREVLRRFSLIGQVRPFQRCLRCNTPLQPVSKEDVLARLKPLTRLYFDEFHLCPACNHVYWKGSHVEHMTHLIDVLREQALVS